MALSANSQINLVDLQDQLDPFLPWTIVGQPLQPVLILDTCLQLRHCHLQCDQLPLKLYFAMHNSDSLYFKVAQTQWIWYRFL